MQTPSHEYREGREGTGTPLPTLDAFLAAEIDCGRLDPAVPSERRTEPFMVLLHCTERTATPLVAERWHRVFESFGLAVEFPPVGCCGIAGLFGHQREHQDMSRRLFDMSWQERLDGVDPSLILATGFSCRCRTERFAGVRPRHPAQALLQTLEPAGTLAC